MSLHLRPDWKWLVRKAWSIRLVVLAGLLSGCEVVLPLFVDALPRNVFAVLSLLAAVGSAVARIIDQPKMERRSQPRAKPDAARADYD
jgi:hypothetical protein